MSKYYYGLPEQETYSSTDPYSALEELVPDYDEYQRIGLFIVEMKTSRKSGCTYCGAMDVYPSEDNEQCGKHCKEYVPRNGRSGVCKNLSYGLIETGRIWVILSDNKLAKIRGRKK